MPNDIHGHSLAVACVLAAAVVWSTADLFASIVDLGWPTILFSRALFASGVGEAPSTATLIGGVTVTSVIVVHRLAERRWRLSTAFAREPSAAAS